MEKIILETIEFLRVNHIGGFDYTFNKQLLKIKESIKNKDIINAYYVLQRELKVQIEVCGLDEYQGLLDELEENSHLIGA